MPDAPSLTRRFARTGSGAPSGALHDPLTRLPTRPLLREHARLALARARRRDREVALLHLGLDDFSLVNDSLGRETGDLVLREVAERLRDAVSEVHVVARIGGDEFAVLLTDLSADAQPVVEAVAGQAVAALAAPFTVHGRAFELSVTAGAALHPGDAPDEEALLRHAEAAMREAKRVEPGGLQFYAGGTTDALERLMLSARLRDALDRDQLLLEFQPIYSLDTGRAPVAEALLRWQDPRRGRIAPLDFIPTAEHTGLIGPIGDWVLDAACAQAAAWHRDGLDVAVSANVSLRQFRDPEFVDRLADRLSEHAVPADRLVVEITESTAMREPRCVKPVLDGLRGLGVRVAIDDFGTGHSSLGRLREMAVDILKLDGSFLPRAPADTRAADLLRAALAIVDALGMTAVVEGVETEAHRSLAAERDGVLGQGFLLSRPLPPREAAAALR